MMMFLKVLTAQEVALIVHANAPGHLCNLPLLGDTHPRKGPDVKKQRQIDDPNLGGASEGDDSNFDRSPTKPISKVSTETPSKTRDIDFDDFCKKADARASTAKQLKPQNFKCWGCDGHADLYCKENKQVTWTSSNMPTIFLCKESEHYFRL